MRGGTVQGYSSRPGEGKGPAVVVIQEWWGVQGQVKAVCDRLALMGFNALAPDLYGGKVIPYHDQAAASAAASSPGLQGRGRECSARRGRPLEEERVQGRTAGILHGRCGGRDRRRADSRARHRGVLLRLAASERRLRQGRAGPATRTLCERG